MYDSATFNKRNLNKGLDSVVDALEKTTSVLSKTLNIAPARPRRILKSGSSNITVKIVFFFHFSCFQKQTGEGNAIFFLFILFI